jgi:hypothetical protein
MRKAVALVAGQGIFYHAGTKVSQGGYMLGHISTNGQFCSIQPANPVEKSMTSRSQLSRPESFSSRFILNKGVKQ